MVILPKHLLQVLALGIAIQACSTLGQQQATEIHAVSTILSEALEIASRITDLKLKDEEIGSIAIFQAIANDYRSAQETSRLVQDSSSMDRTLAEIGGIQARSGDIQSAKALAASIHNSWAKEKIESDIAISLATSGEFSEAVQLASNIKDELLRIIALLNVTIWLAESDDFEGAEKIAQIVSDRVELKDEITNLLGAPNRSSGYAYIAERLARKHRMSEALRVLKLILDPVEQGIAVKALVRASLESDDYDQALRILRSVTREEARSCGLVFLAMHYAKKGDLDKGLEVARSIDPGQESARCAHFPWTAFTLDSTTRESFVFMAAVTGGHARNALMAAEGLSNEESRDHARASIAIAQARNGDPEGGLNTISKPSIQHSDEVLKEIALAYAKAGRDKRALQIANRIESKELGEEIRGQMVFNLAHTGDSDGAARILKDLPDKWNKKFAFIAIAEAQAESGNHKGALATAQLVQQDHDRDIVTGKVATIAARKGNVQDILKWVRELPDPHQRLYGLLGVAKALLVRSGIKDNTSDFPVHFR